MSERPNFRHIVREMTVNQIQIGIADGSFVIPKNPYGECFMDSSVVESALVQAPIGNFLAVQDKYGAYHLIDGALRLHALLLFLEGKKSLAGCHFFPELEGKRSPEISGDLIHRVWSCRIPVVILEPQTPRKLQMHYASRVLGGSPRQILDRFPAEEAV